MKSGLDVDLIEKILEDYKIIGKVKINQENEN